MAYPTNNTVKKPKTTFKINMFKANMVTHALNDHGLDLCKDGAVFDATLPEYMHRYVATLDLETIQLGFKFTAIDNPVIAQYIKSGRQERIVKFHKEQKKASEWHARP